MKKMKMKMMTRAEKEGEREGERERGRQREEREEKKGRETERQNTGMDPKHLCSCANHCQDHKRLLVPRSKQALSRRLQVPAPTKKHAQRLDSLVRVSRRVERDQTSVSSQRVIKRRNQKKLFEQSSTSTIMMTSSRSRDAQSAPNNNSAMA